MVTKQLTGEQHAVNSAVFSVVAELVEEIGLLLPTTFRMSADQTAKRRITIILFRNVTYSQTGTV